MYFCGSFYILNYSKIEKREFFYIAPSISIVDMHFESAVLKGSGISSYGINSDLDPDDDIQLD